MEDFVPGLRNDIRELLRRVIVLRSAIKASIEKPRHMTPKHANQNLRGVSSVHSSTKSTMHGFSFLPETSKPSMSMSILPLQYPDTLSSVGQILKFGNMVYRVIHLLLDLGWVDLDFSCSTACPVLPGLMKICQKPLCSWARRWDTQIKVDQTKVSEQMNHPVQLILVLIGL